jgi:hypothetical protein
MEGRTNGMNLLRRLSPELLEDLFSLGVVGEETVEFDVVVASGDEGGV